jgi:hypothetical protein
MRIPLCFGIKKLVHIFIERIKKKIMNDEVLNTLDFTNFGTCVDCIKGYQTNKTIKVTTRSSKKF